jgi:hypothetical protein
MPELPDAAAFELAPDWVCEVLIHIDAGNGSRAEDADLRT